MVTLFCPQIEAATTAWSSNPATFSISRHSGQDTTHPSPPVRPVNTTSRQKISAFTVICDRGYVLCIILPYTGAQLVSLELHHFIDFIFTFPSELKCWNSSHSALTLVGAVNQTEDTLKISNISIFKYFPSQNTLQTVKFDFQSGKYFLPRDLERLA